MAELDLTKINRIIKETPIEAIRMAEIEYHSRIGEISRKITDDERIKIVYQEENSGPGGARNIGIEHSTGDYIGFVECAVIDKDFYKIIFKITTVYI